jgi:hypothetical protein
MMKYNFGFKAPDKKKDHIDVTLNVVTQGTQVAYKKTFPADTNGRECAHQWAYYILIAEHDIETKDFTDPEETEVQPCPICGADATVYDQHVYGKNRPFVVCECGYYGESVSLD